MSSRPHHRITFKLVVAAALVALLLGLGLGTLEVSIDFAQEEESFDALAMRILVVAKPTASRAVVVIDATLAQEVVHGLLEYDFVSSATITDDLGEVMAAKSKPQAGAAKSWQTTLIGSVSRTYSISLLDDPDAYSQPGSLVITVNSVQAFSPFLDRVINEIAITLVQALAFAFVLMVVFYILVTKPLITLAGAFDRISPREPGKSLLPMAIAQEKDELGMVARSGNQILTAFQDLLHESNLAEERIQAVAEAVSSVSGDNVLERLVASLVDILGVDCAYIGEWVDDRKSLIRTVTFIADGATADNFEYNLVGSPCENVVGKGTCIFNGNVQQEFPNDTGLANLGVETYIGLPLFNSEDDSLGLIVAMHRTPIENPEALSDLLHIFGVRAAAELERSRADAALKESEEQLRAVLDNTTAVIYGKDLEGRYIFSNRQQEKARNLNEGEIVGKTDYDIFPKKVADSLRENDLKVLEKNMPVEFEEVVPGANGEHTYIAIKFPLRDASGKPYAVCGISTDITARKKAENALATQTRNLELAEQMANIGHWRIDVATREIFFSDEMYRIRGFEIGSPVTWERLRDASDPDDWKLAEAANRKAIEEKKGSETDRRIFRPDGEIRIIHSTSKVELGDDGEAVAIIGVSQDITERKRAEEAVVEAEVKLLNITENIADGMFRTNEEGRLLWANTALANMAGFESGAEMVSAVTDVASQIYVNPDDRKIVLQKLRAEGVVKDFVAQFRRAATGETIWGSTNCRAIRGPDGKLYIDGMVRDITESRRNEERMRRVEKMQAVGQLTGGIAHDFNNLLGIVIGNLDMLEADIGDDTKLSRPVATALRAALRGADLTKQLLAFSRQTEERAKPTNLNEVIKGLDNLLAGSLTAEIKVQTFLDNGLWLTEINQGDFEDSLLNLAINARDAMSRGGTLIIETRNTVLESADGGTGNDIPPGEYVMVNVSDSGCGMRKEVVDRIFEPFFTTKSAGTGLGLSLVYGFVQRSNGHIRVYSEPDSGTTIQIYLPHSRQPGKNREIEAGQDDLPPRGSETVLVVDDEPDLVDIAKQTLVTLGYRVLVAGNAKKALQELKKHPDIDILFTDVVMPGGMNGLELAEHALSQIPGLKVLMTSGFSDKIPRSKRHTHLLNSQLAKPYRRNDMVRRIRQVLDHESDISLKAD